MIIENKKTGVRSEVTKNQWEALEAKSWTGKYLVLQDSTETPKLDAVKATVASYSDLVKEGKGFMFEGKIVEALEAFEKAYAIKPGEALKKKIESLKEKIG